MASEHNGSDSRVFTKQQAAFLGRAAILFVLLALFAWAVPAMPSFCLALCWAALSLFSAVSIAYQYVLRKTQKQMILQSEGWLARFNQGRILTLIVSFILSAVLVAGLACELPTWGFAEWLTALAGIPLYLLVHHFVTERVSHEYKPLFRNVHAVLLSSFIVGVLMLIAYAVMGAFEPLVNYGSVTEAFLSAKQPFAESPSALMSEVGKVTALLNGIAAYALVKTATVSFGGYIVWRAVLVLSAYFAYANLLGACSLSPSELKSVFLPLDAVKTGSAAEPVTKYVATACVLPIVLAAGFMIADVQVSEAIATEEYTAAERFVRDQAGLVVYVLDGEYYDQQSVKKLLEEAKVASENLAREREAELIPLINEIYDQRVANVDGYLDWYYSLPADYERLLQFFAGSIESGMEEQLANKINENVDESGLAERLQYYIEQSEALKQQLADELKAHEIDGVPSWLIVSAETIEPAMLEKPLAPSQSFLDAGARMGLSAATGVVAGFVATKVVQRILAKPFFTKIVTSLIEKLALKGLLAVGGTTIAPGVGTAIGVGVGVAADFLFLKADESQNREGYKDEIVTAIEESRAEMIGLVSAPSE